MSKFGIVASALTALVALGACTVNTPAAAPAPAPATTVITPPPPATSMPGNTVVVPGRY